MTLLFTKEDVVRFDDIYPFQLETPIPAIVKRTNGGMSRGFVTHSTYVRCNKEVVTIHFKVGMNEYNKTIKFEDVETCRDMFKRVTT